MRVSRHRLEPEGMSFEFVRSPNQSSVIEPEYLVMHYTADASHGVVVSWFRNPQAEASAHLVIGRDGRITQMVPFNRKAWHAGTSRWLGREAVNGFSIGIELVNAGSLERREDGSWANWKGDVVPEDQVVVRRHPNDGIERGWQTYSSEQMDVATSVGAMLVRKYGLKDVIGHENVSPGRKIDPGPAFPMASFRSKVIGRERDERDVLRTTTALNIRVGPGPHHDRLAASPLPPGAPVEVLDGAGVWKLVDVLEFDPDLADVVGWVHGGHLAP